MRKLLFVLIALFTLVSCEVSKPDPKQDRENAQKEVLTGKFSFEQTIHVMRSYNLSEGKFTSEKHQYKVFKSGAGKHAIMGITHDPNCQYCFELYD